MEIHLLKGIKLNYGNICKTCDGTFSEADGLQTDIDVKYSSL